MICRILATISMTCLVASATFAQVGTPKPPISIYAGGGLSVPQTSETVDIVQNGFHAFAGLGLRLIPMASIGPRLEFTNLPSDFAALDLAGIEGGDTKIFSATIDSRFSFAPPLSPIKPFFTAGIGVASVKQDEIDIPIGLVTSLSESDFGASQTKMTWSLGAGMDIASSPMMSFFLQGRYLSIQTDGEAFNYIPVSLGLRFF